MVRAYPCLTFYGSPSWKRWQDLFSISFFQALSQVPTLFWWPSGIVDGCRVCFKPRCEVLQGLSGNVVAPWRLPNIERFQEAQPSDIFKAPRRPNCFQMPDPLKTAFDGFKIRWNDFLSFLWEALRLLWQSNCFMHLFISVLRVSGSSSASSNLDSCFIVLRILLLSGSIFIARVFLLVVVAAEFRFLWQRSNSPWGSCDNFHGPAAGMDGVHRNGLKPLWATFSPCLRHTAALLEPLVLSRKRLTAAQSSFEKRSPRWGDKLRLRRDSSGALLKMLTAAGWFQAPTPDADASLSVGSSTDAEVLISNFIWIAITNKQKLHFNFFLKKH